MSDLSDAHLAALAIHESQVARTEVLIDADRNRKYREMLDDAWDKVATSGPNLEKFDAATEAIFQSADLVAKILTAYRKGERLLEHVEALHDHLRAEYEGWQGDKIRERAEAAVLQGDDE